MMKTKSHSISGAFVFMLLGVFAVFSMLLVVLGAQADALTAAQSLADRLYAADEREDVLRQSGFFERGDGTWHLSCGAYDLLVTLGEETYSAGTLETAEVTALENEQTIFTLPSARYVQGEVAP